MRYIAMMLIGCGLLAVAAPAEARRARCVVDSGKHTVFAGACDFRPDRGGGFSLTAPGGKPLSRAITMVSVAVIGTDAEISGLTRDGINSRWGMARRSAKDRACWIGDDFRVCAY